MLICWGPDRTTFFNDAFLPMLGDKAAQALGSPLQEFLPELWELLAPAVEQVLTTGAPVATASQRLPREIDPDRRFIGFSVSPILNSSGGVSGVFCSVVEGAEALTASELAERERLRESEARLKLGAVVAGLALAEIDYATDWVHLSAEAAHMFGFGEAATVVPHATFYSSVPAQDKEELMRRIEASVSPSGPGWFDMDYRIVWPSGETRWLRVRKQVFFKVEGTKKRAERALLAALDVTTEKTASEKIRRSEDFLRSVLNSLPQQVAVLDDTGMVRMVNEPWKRFARQNGGALEAVSVGVNYLEMCRTAAKTEHPYAKEALTGLEAVLNGSREQFLMEYPCDGPNFPRWFTLHATRSASGSTGVVVSHMDITERKWAEDALRESMERERRRAEELRTIFDTAPMGLAIARDADGRHIVGNRACEKLFGVAPGSELSKRAPEPPKFELLLDGNKLALSDAPMQRAVRGEAVSDQIVDLLREDGQRASILAKTAPLFDEFGRPRGAVGAFLDITALKKAEAALRESEEQLRLFIEYAPAAVAMFDRDMRYLAVSRRWCCDYNLDFMVIGRSHYDVLPEIPEHWREVHRRALAGEVIMSDGDSFQRADGSVQWQRWEVRPWRRPDDEIGGIVVFSEDITVRKAAEEQTRLFEALAEQSQEFIGICDLSFSPIFINPAGLRMVGLSSLQQGKEFPAPQFFFPEDRAFITDEFFPRVLREGQQEIEIRFRHFGTGEALWMQYSVFSLTDAAGRVSGFATVSRDITEFKRTQQKLIEAQRSLQAVMRVVPVGIGYTDESGCEHVSGNPTLYSMFEISPQDNISASAPNLTRREGVCVTSITDTNLPTMNFPCSGPSRNCAKFRQWS